MKNQIPTTLRQKAIPGILGGLSPSAHVYFERKLIQNNVIRGARYDKEHPVWLTISATNIPDRTESLLRDPESCVVSLSSIETDARKRLISYL